MTATHFLITGEFIRPNGFSNFDTLGFLAETREEALATCRRHNPHFHITGIRIAEEGD